MSFRVTQKTLESLEWPQVARRLREECRTPRQETGNSFADFAEGLSEVKARLTETSEARALLDGDQVAPLGGVVELYAAFQHAEKGGTLTPQLLLDVRSTLVALHETKRFLEGTAEQAEAILPKLPPDEPVDDTPAGRVDAFRGWVWLAVVLLAYPLGHSLVTKGFGATWTINAYNTVFLTLALLLHGRPLPFLRACRQGVDTAWGLILQFPFYAGIFGVMQNAGLGAWLGGLFERIATTAGYPLLVYLYSGVMNLFVPSGGSKWLIEAPYLIPAGEEMGVSVITVMLAYAYGDSTTNLIQPLWAIPVLAVTRMRFGDIVGYTFLVALACLAVNIVAMLVIPAAL